MKKFTRQTLKGRTTIYECEVSIVVPRPFGLHAGEDLYKFETPVKLKGEEWFSMFFQDSLEDCKSKVKEDIRCEFIRGKDKKDIIFSEKDIEAKLLEVEVLLIHCVECAGSGVVEHPVPKDIKYPCPICKPANIITILI